MQILNFQAARQSRERFAQMFGKPPARMTVKAKRKAVAVSQRREQVRSKARSAL